MEKKPNRMQRDVTLPDKPQSNNNNKSQDARGPGPSFSLPPTKTVKEESTPPPSDPGQWFSTGGFGMNPTIFKVFANVLVVRRILNHSARQELHRSSCIDLKDFHN